MNELADMAGVPGSGPAVRVVAANEWANTAIVGIAPYAQGIGGVRSLLRLLGIRRAEYMAELSLIQYLPPAHRIVIISVPDQPDSPPAPPRLAS